MFWYLVPGDDSFSSSSLEIPELFDPGEFTVPVGLLVDEGDLTVSGVAVTLRPVTATSP